MYGYIYETTNLINGKKYIGQHKCKNFDEKYIGSGTYLHHAINKYGRENFECKMIEECDSREQLNEREIYWINFYNAVNSDCFYNIVDGGGGISGYKHSDDTKIKISKSHIGKKYSNETRKRMSNAQKLYFSTHDIYNKGVPMSDTQKLKLSNSLKEKYKDEDYKLRVRNGRKYTCGKANNSYGRIAINNGINMKFVKEDELSEYLNNGWNKGQIKNNSHYMHQKVKCPYCDRFISKSNLNKHINGKHKEE